MFLLNQFLIDCKEAQDKGMEFHYAWLLILIALVAWREPEDTQFLGAMKKPCLAARYVNLWHTVHKERQLDNNIMFYVYKEVIQMSIQNTPCILPQVVEAYKGIACFKDGRHHMYIQAKKDPEQQWLSCRYKLTEVDVGQIIEDWEDEWKTPVPEAEQSEPQQSENRRNKDDEEEEEEEEGEGYGTGGTQKTVPHPRREAEGTGYGKISTAMKEEERNQASGHPGPVRG
jgi:hypothetical protein